MATIFTHVLLPVAFRVSVGPGVVSKRLLFMAMVATILPDADVLAFVYGIPYSDAFGHRGFTHSVVFALAAGVLAMAAANQLGSTKRIAFLVIFLAMVSHALLDAFTNGGLGVALGWPFSEARYFMPWQPIEVSPIGARGFFTARGLEVIVSEIFWVIVPLAIMTACSRFIIRRKSID